MYNTTVKKYCIYFSIIKKIRLIERDRDHSIDLFFHDPDPIQSGLRSDRIGQSSLVLIYLMDKFNNISIMNLIQWCYYNKMDINWKKNWDNVHSFY